MSAEGSAWSGRSDSRPDGTKPDLPPVKYLRADAVICSLADLDVLVEYTTEAGECDEGASESIIAAPCPEGSVTLAPLWVQRLQPDGSYGPPEQVTERQCITPADVAAQAERVFTTMHVPTPPATLQSTGTTLLVNAWYPAYTAAQPVTQTATLLGVDVEVRAVPAQFVWDFDDPFSPSGSSLTTTDPGRPWAAGDGIVDDDWVAHAWTRLGDPGTAPGRAAGTAVTPSGVTYRTGVTVTLTTVWHGQFRIAGTATWTDIAGQITTTSAAGTFTVSEARTELVCEALDGTVTC